MSEHVREADVDVKGGVLRKIGEGELVRDLRLVVVVEGVGLCVHVKGKLNKIVVGVDAKNGYVAVEGWAKIEKTRAIDLAQRYEDAGVSAIIYTDIDRDGLMKGPNIGSTIGLAQKTNIPVILSGGISSMHDLEEIKRLGGNTLEGVISGRAIYDGAIEPESAVNLLREN